MSEPAWVTEGRRLVAGGMSINAAANKLGKSYSALWRGLNPEKAREHKRRDNARPGRQAAKNAWERQASSVLCVDCSVALSNGSVRKGATRCAACAKDHQRHAHREIERLWNQGFSRVYIAGCVGLTPESVSVRISEMRREGGWNLPYRYKPQGRWTPKWSEQEAA